MRNPKNSWDKSDSVFGYNQCENCNHNHLCDECSRHDPNNYAIETPVIGENDMKLAQQLIRAGSEHRKFMRQIFVSVDITAPLYWWKEFDTYKVGTVANSTSTMHKLASTPITIECFETDDMKPVKIQEDDYRTVNVNSCFFNHVISLISLLEELRQKYFETKDKTYWKELIRWLPESWLQTSTFSHAHGSIARSLLACVIAGYAYLLKCVPLPACRTLANPFIQTKLKQNKF